MILEKLKNMRRGIAVLIDPEKLDELNSTCNLLEAISKSNIDFIFVGGSSASRKEVEQTVQFIKSKTTLPIVLFPGASHQIDHSADAILFLSLISGRNPDFLIGHQIEAAQELNESNLEVISTSYLLIDGHSNSSVAYVSQTTPIPRDHISIAYRTALAGKLLGHNAIFLDAGSGAKKSVSREMIHKLATIGTPLIIGGGLKTIEEIMVAHEAGANIVVIGNQLEKDIDLLLDIQNYKARLNSIP